jgi:hypothetical protein
MSITIKTYGSITVVQTPGQRRRGPHNPGQEARSKDQSGEKDVIPEEGGRVTFSRMEIAAAEGFQKR